MPLASPAAGRSFARTPPKLARASPIARSSSPHAREWSSSRHSICSQTMSIFAVKSAPQEEVRRSKCEVRSEPPSTFALRTSVRGGETVAIRLTVNQQIHELDVPPDTPLLYVLMNDLALQGP